MATTRTMILAHVSPHTLHGEGSYNTDECIVEVIATARGGSARTLVRCLFDRTTHHVHPCAVH